MTNRLTYSMMTLVVLCSTSDTIILGYVFGVTGALKLKSIDELDGTVPSKVLRSISNRIN